MAYVPGQKLQDPNDPNAQQPGAPASAAPTISGAAAPAVGGVSGAAGSAVGSSPVAQSNASQGGAGTGFVNIDRYLGANQGAAKDVQAKAGQALQKENTNFDAATQPARSAIFDASKLQQQQEAQDPSQLVKNVTGTTSGDMRNAAVAAATDAVNASYKGPSSVTYDVGNTDEAKRAAALGNSATAGKQIASDNGTLGQYGTGLSAIDRAIYGSAQEAPTMQATQAATGKQLTSENTQKDSIAQEAGDRSKAIADNAAKVRGAFQDEAQKIQMGAADKAKAANDQQTADMQNHVLRDPNTGQVIQVPQGQQLGGWEAGSGNATAANFLDANGLNAIGSVLGDQTMQGAKAGPAFTSGRYTSIPGSGYYDQGQLAVNPVNAKIEAENAASIGKPAIETTQAVYAATKDLNPAQKTAYQQIKQQYPQLTAAQAAEDARNGNDANQRRFGGGQRDQKAPVGQLQVKETK